MPKSKRHVKRRKKVKNKNTSKYAYVEEEFEYPNGYTKTNGKGETMLMDKNHNFVRFLTEKEILGEWHP